MSHDLGLLLSAAASVGLIHTLAGPDHTLPFVAMARARDWGLGRTLWITGLCGVGHVAGSLVLGAVGIAVGWSLGRMEWLEALRGDLAAWLLLGFGLAYASWGLRRALRQRPHTHRHVHADGTVHDHQHDHGGGHAHVHDHGEGKAAPWALFVLFVLGPCEALLPLLMVPAAESAWGSVALVAATFGAATVATMVVVVAILHRGAVLLRLRSLERYAHLLAGLAIAACGVAMLAGL